MVAEYHETAALGQAAQEIRDFCASPAQPTGGILLVCGLRGVGKTRLVDHALNERRRWIECASQWEQLKYFLWEVARTHCGLDPYRHRRNLIREPRGARRILLPVSVDPFFPGTAANSRRQTVTGIRRMRKDSGTSNNEASRSSPEMEGDVLNLLYNLVFALTSVVDARSGSRRFGRTLSSWLGWVRLWFSPTALLRPQGRPGGLWIAVLLSLMYGGAVFSTGAVQSLLRTGLISSWNELWCWALPAFSVFPITVLMAWFWLRFLDLRGLCYMGSQLYDLVHAQSVEKDLQASLENRWQLQAKRREWGRLLGIFLLGGGVFVSALPELVVPEKSSVGSAAAVRHVPTKPADRARGAEGSGGTLRSESRVVDHSAGSTAYRFPLDRAVIWGGALVAFLGLLSLTFSASYSRRLHATFGAENRTWMITLLRRYLYMLHRAGFEPVLVVDEIDKLGEDVHGAENGGRFGAGGCADFDRFKSSLLRLKQSLGAEFTWVLIDSHLLIEQVIRDRRLREPGPFATLIQSEVVLGPLSFGDALGYVSRQFSGEGGRADGGAPPSPDLVARWWLEGRGIFSHLVRVVDGYRCGREWQASPRYDRLAHFIALVVESLLADNLRGVVASGAASPGQQEMLGALFERSAWHRIWVEIGVVSLAANLFSVTLTTPTYSEYFKGVGGLDGDGDGGGVDTHDFLTDPARLRGLGERALIVRLYSLYVRGDSGLGVMAPRQAGIDRQPVRGNYDAEMRVVVPENWSPPARR